MKRTIQTAEHMKYSKKQWKALDELDAGVCDGLTYEEIEARYPEDFRARDDDKSVITISPLPTPSSQSDNMMC